jgi:hypothetical protein
MTNRERAFAALGLEYAEGIESCHVIIVPSTGREIRRRDDGRWECQPWNDNYWRSFDDLLEAVTWATPPDYRRGSPPTAAAARAAEAVVQVAVVQVRERDIDVQLLGRWIDQYTNLPELLAAAEEAADWLTETPPGTDQFERGQRLRREIERSRTGRVE